VVREGERMEKERLTSHFELEKYINLEEENNMKCEGLFP